MDQWVREPWIGYIGELNTRYLVQSIPAALLEPRQESSQHPQVHCLEYMGPEEALGSFKVYENLS